MQLRDLVAYKMRATSKLVETIWIFEKETEKLFDDTPVYEGVIIEYLHRVKVKSCSQSTGNFTWISLTCVFLQAQHIGVHFTSNPAIRCDRVKKNFVGSKTMSRFKWESTGPCPQDAKNVEIVNIVIVTDAPPVPI